jgi:cysteine-S-conjugate beta-lyase
MSFDFDTVQDRRHSDSAKWTQIGMAPLPADVLPLWVADMDFRSPESVIEALRQRADEGIFGYSMGNPALRTAIVDWLATRQNWTVNPNDIYYLPALVSALTASVRAYSGDGDNVVTLTPVYPPFLAAARVSDRELRTVDMVTQETNSVIRYEIDFDALERAIDSRTKLLMLCSPHNPVGRVYTRAELERLAEIVLKHDLVVCSDEIHADLLLSASHVPFASISPEMAQRTITLSAPSKTFNVPGLGFGFAVISDKDLLAKFNKVTEMFLPHPGPMGYVAALAAYTDTSGWLEALLAYIKGNRDYLVETLTATMPQVKVTNPEGTYLAWVDCRALQVPAKHAQEFFLKEAKVALNYGGDFGKGYEGFVRINLGCSRSVLVEALERMRLAVAALESA